MKKSFGILLFRRSEELEFLLVHPGGPFWKNKNNGTWSIPKGEGTGTEDPLATAKREFEEEVGQLPVGELIELKSIHQKGNKEVFCWAIEGDFDPTKFISNVFDLEWPPRSGKFISIPEVDEARWFNYAEASTHINERQLKLIEDLIQKLDAREKTSSGV
jgi:predicted NUDIX family NTP pyrophosphohydrolase